jgi:hypothetical protein
MNTRTYDRPNPLLERRYFLRVSDLDTLHRTARLHGLDTAAEALTYILRTYAAPELERLDPEGKTIPAPPRRPYRPITEIYEDQQEEQQEPRKGLWPSWGRSR